MTTLIVAETQAKAKAYFEEKGLSEEAEDYFIGFGAPLYGARFDEILFIEDYVLNRRSLDWILRGVIGRLSPSGRIRFL